MKRVVVAVFVTDRPVVEPASMLRGCIGDRFSEHEVLHNHREEGYIYRYPLVQYKLLDGIPTILGIEAGAEVLIRIFPEIENFQLAGNNYEVVEKRIIQKKYGIQPTPDQRSYSFASPWIGFNQTNHDRYRKCTEWRERKVLLNRILTGNILSMCKGLGITIEKNLDLHTHLDSTKAHYKGFDHHAFYGNFRVNFDIPDLFGLGKGVSHGFGVILPVKN
jgi:hypothetical protein